MEGLGLYFSIVLVMFVYYIQILLKLVEVGNEVLYLQEMVRQQNKNLKPEVIAKAILEAKVNA